MKATGVYLEPVGSDKTNPFDLPALVGESGREVIIPLENIKIDREKLRKGMGLITAAEWNVDVVSNSVAILEREECEHCGRRDKIRFEECKGCGGT